MGYADSAPRTLRMPGYLPRVADREIDGASGDVERS